MKKNMIYKAALLLATAMLAGCAADNATHENTDKTGGGTTRPLTDFASARTSDTPARRVPATPKTRTSMDNHQYLTGGDFMWEPGDNIYVKDDAGVLNKDASSNITAKQPTARFQVSGTYTASSTYEVRYTGTAASATASNVTIAPSQTQAAPNDTKHFGASGDCGTATATRVGDHFEFMLDHKAAYLCFLPRVTNAALAPNVYLTKIVVKSDNAIAGDYTLSLAGLGSTPTANGTNTITLTTQGASHVNGFPLPTATSIAANAAYMVIAPGTHSLTVDYYIKDPVTGVEGSITKTLPVGKNYEANKVYDVTANLTPKDYASEYYTAEESETFNLSPNSNLMVWYAEKGSPHWDSQSIWSTQGHLYNAGMWYKKAAVIAVENSLSVAELNERDPQGNDLRPLTFSNLSGDALVTTGRPSLSEMNNWFYVPALGYQYNGVYEHVGAGGFYFTANTQGNSVSMHLTVTGVASRVDDVGGSILQMPLWFGENSSPLK